MFGGLMKLLEILQSRKTKNTSKSVKKAEKSKNHESLTQKLNILQSKAALDKDKAIQNGKKNILKEKSKLLVLKILTLVVSFLESILIGIVSLIGVMGFFIILVAVVVIIIVMSLLTSLDNIDKPDNMTDIPQDLNSGYKTELNWDAAELAMYGNLLTDVEKNYFRLIMLAKQTVTDYPELSFTGDSKLDMKFLVGISSSETGMKFFASSNDNRDILKYPSDIQENNLSYGMYGISASKKLTDYISEETATKIKSIYTPVIETKTDARYSPWGVVMSGSHSQMDMKTSIKTTDTYAIMDKVMLEYGISANKEQLKNISIWYLSNAKYHGASGDEFEAYLGFLYAMWAASSDDDSKRSLDNWSLIGDGIYGEYSYRHCFVGDKGAQEIEKYNSFSDITYSTSHSTRIALNGAVLSKPLWGYLHDKYYSSNIAFQKAEHLMIEFANMVDNSDGSGKGLRVLNFHYGINSYLQGNRLVKAISSRLPLSTGLIFNDYGFKTAKAGEIQGNWQDSKVAGSLKKSTHKSKFGVAYGLDYANSIMYDGLTFEQWRINSKWKVPYYRQSSSAKEGQVSYGKMTLSINGCHIYMNAYIASALTGKLINPVEMMEAMIATGSLQTNGYYNNTYTSVDNVFDALGIYYIRGDMGSSMISGDDLSNFETLLGSFKDVETKEEWKEKVDKLLSINGIVGLSTGSRTTSLGLKFTAGENHYIVITEKVGDKYKTMGYGTGSNGYKRDCVEHTWDDLYYASVGGSYKGQIYFAYNPNVNSILSNNKDIN